MSSAFRFPRVLLVTALALAALASSAWADRRDEARAQVAFGIEAAKAGLWREAVFRFERAVAIDPTYAAAHNNLAIAHEQAGEREKARLAYKKALALDPKNSYIVQNYDLFKEIHDRSRDLRKP